MKKLNIACLFTLLTAIVFMSCEDVVHPTLENVQPVLVVDAWINNKAETQKVIVTMTQPYFENVTPPGVSGAAVSIADDHGKTFIFIESDKMPGVYQWVPPTGEVFGTVGDKYTLTIQVNGETYTAESKMGRVPVIDSLTYDTEKRTGSTDSISRGEFWATDPAGTGDAYWIRTYKNGILLNKPSEINIAYDAGFSAGGATDGVVFITPVRRGINSVDEDANGRRLSPIENGDSLNVQLYSVTGEAFSYLNQVAIQTDRPGGFQELFSTPLSNVPTNINNVNASGSHAVGFFTVSAVSVKGKRFKKK